MREVLISGFIALLVLGGALVMFLSLAAWVRRRRWRAALLESFACSFEQGMTRSRSYDRDRMFVGDGWIDTYRGTVGALPYVLSVTIEPWVRTKTYRLHLTAPSDPKTGESRSQDYVFRVDPNKAPDALLVRFHADVRERVRRDDDFIRPEAS